MAGTDDQVKEESGQDGRSSEPVGYAASTHVTKGTYAGADKCEPDKNGIEIRCRHWKPQLATRHRLDPGTGLTLSPWVSRDCARLRCNKATETMLCGRCFFVHTTERFVSVGAERSSRRQKILR